MRRVLLIALCSFAFTGCEPQDGQTPTAAYRHARDKIVNLVPVLSMVDVMPCRKTEHLPGGDVLATIPVDQCFKMDPPRRWKGVLRLQRESSWFCPAPPAQCPPNEPKAELMDVHWPSNPPRARYLVEFVGRRSQLKAGHGGWGGLRYQIIADRVISIHYLGEAPFEEP